MKKIILFALIGLILLAVNLVPAATPAGPDTTAMLAKIKANVAKIADPQEKERWMCNIDLWDAALAGKPMAGLQSSVEKMKANVAKITAGLPEKDRWQANINLWQTYLADAGKASPADTAKMKAALDGVKAKIASIADASEKERWQSNIDLWAAKLAKP